MILNWILFKIKAFFLVFVNLFRRALCCFRKRRHSFSEPEPLTHVISNVDNYNESQTWSEWGDNFKDNQPKTVQDYIDQYREQTMKAKVAEEPETEPNLFEDMAPQITRQAKVLVRNKHDNVNKRSSGSRLSAVEDSVNVIPPGELGEWDENSGWDGEHLLDQEAQKILREQKRQERERKAWEQHQKRLEKSSRTLGSKLAT